jgi:hypothetical protein
LVGQLKEGDSLEELDVNEKVILKWSQENRMRVCGQDSIFFWVRIGTGVEDL